MSYYARESEVDPYVLLAQEDIRSVAQRISKLGEISDGKYVLSFPPQSLYFLSNEMAKCGLQQFIDTSDNPYLDKGASKCSVELFGSYTELPMYVTDMVNSNESSSGVYIPGFRSWSSSIGFTIPYLGEYMNGDQYTIEHSVTVVADSSDDLPTIQSVADVVIIGRTTTEDSLPLHRNTTLTPEQTLAFTGIVRSFSNRPDRVM